MSVQLSELIERIKKEGVESAEQEATRIKEQAEQEAAGILAAARREAQEIAAKARSEAERFQATGKEGVRQAARDVVLDLKKQLTTMLGRILNREINKALEGQAVRDGLSSLFANWKSDATLDYEVLVPAETWNKIKESLLDGLAAEMKRGVEIKPSGSVRAGFRISEKDGSAYFDFTDRGLTEFLMEYLNPRLAESLGESGN
jgi:V/A-type H+-transporting ATPase subunit E